MVAVPVEPEGGRSDKGTGGDKVTCPLSQQVLSLLATARACLGPPLGDGRAVLSPCPIF